MYPGLGFISVGASTAAGSVVPGIGNAVGAVVGIIGQLFGGIIGAFKGDTEEESWKKHILPIIQPYVQQNQIPVSVFHYGLVWVLTPQGQVVSLTPPDGSERGLRVSNEEADVYTQQYADSTGKPVASLEFKTEYLKDPYYVIFYPESAQQQESLQLQQIIALEESGVELSPYLADLKEGLESAGVTPEIKQAGFGSSPLVAIAAGAALLAFALGKKK